MKAIVVLGLVAQTLLIAVALVNADCNATVGTPNWLRTNLVKDIGNTTAYTDPLLKNPWGIEFQNGGNVYIANNHAGVVSQYGANGKPLGTVTIPAAHAGETGSPTGISFNKGAGFSLPEGHRAEFVVATEDGLVAGYNPAASVANAFIAIDNSATDAYKGVTFGFDGVREVLYLADFKNGRVRVYGPDWVDITASYGADAFVLPNNPTGYHPFNVYQAGAVLFVAYAKLDESSGDEIDGAGMGVIAAFSAETGAYLKRIGSGGNLNAPWGLVLAPVDPRFGVFSGRLFVGNFGDGKVHAFDVNQNNCNTAVRLATGPTDFTASGLWGLSFGNGVRTQGENCLYFAAGLNDEADGIYGRLDLALLQAAE